MTVKMLAAVAAVAALASFAQAPAADAGPFKRGAKAAHAQKFVAAKRVARARFGGAGKLSSGRRPQANPGQAGVNYALALYVRRCLDNILPECPK
ncbi:MAG: hypothetical protein KDJ47_13190 [Hyphomicrobiaceae bacterium]|nr:hypothetical protein [Hyphomicrobiaceae bacterium]